MRENYLSIQYLRAIAALLVVIYHARNPQAWLFNPLENFHGFARGVDVFFVISGFIMAAIGSKEAPFDFARKRIIRVAPIYWITSIFAALILLRKSTVNQEFIEHLALSLLFIPHLNPSNEAFPILPPGWTLNYEMYFYAIFFFCLWTKNPIRNCVATLLVCVTTGAIFRPENVLASTYTNHLLIEFSAGLLIGQFRKEIASRPFLSLLAPVGIALLFGTRHWSLAASGAALIVAGGLALESRIKYLKIGKDLGDASYFIYLSHHFILAALLKIWEKLPIDGWHQFLSFVLTCVVTSSAAGLIGHHVIEKPLTKSLNRRLSPASKSG